MRRSKFQFTPIHRRAGIPPVAVHILNVLPCPAPCTKAARLVRHRIVWRVRERAERAVADVCASGVPVVFGARCTVLQVVLARVLRHPRAFDERRRRAVAMIPTESLPPMLRRLETKEPLRRALVDQVLALVQLDAVQRIRIRRIPVQKPAFRVRIVKELRVPRPGCTESGLASVSPSRSRASGSGGIRRL